MPKHQIFNSDFYIETVCKIRYSEAKPNAGLTQ